MVILLTSNLPMTNLIRFRRQRRRRKLPRVAILSGALAIAGCIALVPPEFPQKPDTFPKSAVLIDRVTRVRDGDTIVVGLIPIRIANLDCAEGGTAAGDRATRRAKQLIAGQMLMCRLEGRRSYDREVGICSLESGQDFGEALIAEGYCSRWRG